MAKRFKIAQNPTFKAKVELPRIGEDAIPVTFEFKYMTRNKLAEMYESWRQTALSLNLPEDATFSDLTTCEIDLQVKQISDIIVGWDFDDEFNEDNIRALVDSGLSPTKAIIAAFQEAYTKAQVGN
jgi:hypothetical protein